jgi:hypothetical protein
MHRKSILALLVATAAAASLAPTAARSQSSASATGATPAPASMSMLAGGYTLADFPSGDWGKIAGFGIGLDASDIMRKQGDKPFSVRTNLGFVYNFSRTQDVPQSNLGPNSKLALQTKNTSLTFGVGPEFSKPSAAATPFVYGTAGFNRYWTSSDLSGTAGGSPYDSKFGDSRIAFAWSARPARRINSSCGSAPCSEADARAVRFARARLERMSDREW